MKKLQYQNGFSAAEVLIVIVIVGLIATVGWLVYDRQNNKTNSTSEIATQTSSQSESKTDEQAMSEYKDDADTTEYLVIQELGVKFELSDKLSGLSYSIGNENKTAYFTPAEIKGAECSGQVSLSRYSDADFGNDPYANKGGARKIGDYYYFVSGSQSSCSDDLSLQKKADQLRADLSTLLPNALISL